MVLFFVEGIYPCLLHRLAQYRMIASSSTVVGNQVYHHNGINNAQLYVKFRQLLWLVTVAAIATSSVTYNFDNTQYLVRSVVGGIHSVSSSCKQAIFRCVDKVKKVFGYTNVTPAANDDAATVSADGRGNMHALRCNICYARAANTPYISPCNHTFCYLCISSEMEDVQNGIYTCPTCHKIIHEVKRYQPDEARDV